MSIYDRNIALPESELTEVDLQYLYSTGSLVTVISTLPAWFVNNTDLLGYSTFWQITPPIDGTYQYDLEVKVPARTQAGQPQQYTTHEAVLTLTVQDVFENVDNCCSDQNINIVWLNRQGGRGNFIFTQRKDFTVDIGGSNTFITDDIIKYSEVKGVYDGKTVYCTGLSQTAVDYLDTLRYAIQAWIFNPSNTTFTPILIPKDPFTKYTTKENLYEVVISFIYAKELKIQRQ